MQLQEADWEKMPVTTQLPPLRQENSAQRSTGGGGSSQWTPP